MSTSVVSPLVLMAFLNIFMWASGLVFLTLVGYCNFLYDSLVASFEIGCTTGGWYHGGINIHGLGANHPKDPIGGLKGGFLNGSPPCELPLGEFTGCLPSGGLW